MQQNWFVLFMGDHKWSTPLVFSPFFYDLSEVSEKKIVGANNVC